MTSLPSKLFLHIGRNKAGSTTLRASWLRKVEALQAAGIQYALFGQPNPSGFNLPSFSSHMELIAYLERRPDRSVLISNEGLCCFDKTFARSMAEDLSKLDVLLLFYVRPYTSWAVSDYTFNVLIGEETRNFDEYLTALGDNVGFWAALEVWGEAIGWDRLRIRSLHPDDLSGGDLGDDGLAALGIAPLDHAPAPMENAAPAWISTEILRAVLTDGDKQLPTARFALSEILALSEWIDLQVRIAASELGLSLDRGAYITLEQALRLEDLYNADLDRVESKTGTKLRKDDMSNYKGRTFLPSIAHVPRQITEYLRRSANATPRFSEHRDDLKIFLINTLNE